MLNSFDLGGLRISTNSKSIVIAEIGPNHNGSLSEAKKLIDFAKKAGCSAVKFQYHLADHELSTNKSKIPWTGHNRYEFIKEVQEFKLSDHKKLRDYTKSKNLAFISSPFSLKAAENLKNIGVDAYKIASGEISNKALLEFCAKTRKPILISTGMSNLEEIDQSVKFVRKFTNKVIIMQCTSLYPTPSERVNLNLLEYFRKKYKLHVGLSDHTLTSISCIGAVALGAKILEKHFTRNKLQDGPDHFISLNFGEMSKLVKDIRELEICIGRKEKNICKEIKKVRKTFYNSLVTQNLIPKGTKISKSDVIEKKPGGGISPFYISKVIGRKSKRLLKKNHLLKWSDFE